MTTLKNKQWIKIAIWLYFLCWNGWKLKEADGRHILFYYFHLLGWHHLNLILGEIWNSQHCSALKNIFVLFCLFFFSTLQTCCINISFFVCLLAALPYRLEIKYYVLLSHVFFFFFFCQTTIKIFFNRVIDVFFSLYLCKRIHQWKSSVFYQVFLLQVTQLLSLLNVKAILVYLCLAVIPNIDVFDIIL